MSPRGTRFPGRRSFRWLKESYFEVERFEVILRRSPDRNIGRGFALARAESGVNFHHYFPDLYLHRFFEPYGAASEEAGKTDR